MLSGLRSEEAEERSGGASRATREESIFEAADTRRGAEQTAPPPMLSGLRSEEAEERSGGASRATREEQDLQGGGHATRSGADSAAADALWTEERGSGGAERG